MVDRKKQVRTQFSGEFSAPVQRQRAVIGTGHPHQVAASLKFAFHGQSQREIDRLLLILLPDCAQFGAAVAGVEQNPFHRAGVVRLAAEQRLHRPLQGERCQGIDPVLIPERRFRQIDDRSIEERPVASWRDRQGTAVFCGEDTLFPPEGCPEAERPQLR